MTSIDSVTLEVPDPMAAEAFHSKAFGLDDRVGVRASEAPPTSGFRGRAAAKDAGVDPDGSGSHRIVIGSDAEPFTDPDGFAWETTPTRH